MLVSLCCSFFLTFFFLITCFSCPSGGSGVTLAGITCVQHRAALASPLVVDCSLAVSIQQGAEGRQKRHKIHASVGHTPETRHLNVAE